MIIADIKDATRAQALKDAAHASLQGSAKSKAANKLVATLGARLAAYESEHATYEHKPGAAVERCKIARNTDPLRGDIASNSDPS
jgi:hypothetical protein